MPRDERFPDAELRCEDDVRPFEVVEADMETRRRCDEFRRGFGRTSLSLNMVKLG